jgi:hypothetical protein
MSDGFDIHTLGADGHVTTRKAPPPTLPHVDALPRIRMLAEEFTRLSDYSATLPTGATIGKRWRRLEGCFDTAFKQAGGKPRWIIGEYIRHPTNPGLVRVKW